ncbi:preprotein translocase subunit SecY [Candidatus Micrarchaeota archaeon]|nr:preprotein translocase subunit SecY [Candidatus Micrarchaeota archaeon]
MRLDVLKPIVKLLPEVRVPERIPTLNEKLLWTLIALLIFFTMYHVFPIGVDVTQLSSSQFAFLEVILASRIGSLITVGIGPIILASIFLQLFMGAKIIEIDLKDPDQKALFQGVQKILAIFLCIVEPAVYVFSPGGLPVLGQATGTAIVSIFFTQFLVLFQLALGSIILLYLDEVVSKYGIGSGISLFIAAGVSLSVVQGTIGLIGLTSGISPERTVLYAIQQGGANAIANAIIALLPVLFTAVVFLASTYAEGMKIEIPLAFERARGFGGRFPIKFLYVSNIPVILASALLLNFQLLARAISGLSPINIGNADIIKTIADVGPGGTIQGGLIYFLTPTFPNPLFVGYQGYLAYFSGARDLIFPFLGTISIPLVVHAITYLAFLIVLCIIFGKFWIETTGMGPKEVSEQLQRSGLQIPGYRRDPRIVEKVLDRYIPVITILGSAFVGVLAGFADLTGALGTGTGILLTVGILHKFYEELTTQRMFEMYPQLRKLVG